MADPTMDDLVRQYYDRKSTLPHLWPEMQQVFGGHAEDYINDEYSRPPTGMGVGVQQLDPPQTANVLPQQVSSPVATVIQQMAAQPQTPQASPPAEPAPLDATSSFFGPTSVIKSLNPPNLPFDPFTDNKSSRNTTDTTSEPLF